MKTLREIKDLEGLDEQLGGRYDPPMILILKRKAIRLFPSGEKVALYHSDKLGIDVSIPYSSTVDKIQKIAGIGEEFVDESVHDNMFGDYTEALKKHYDVGSRHTDHPELLKMKQKIINKYGKEAHAYMHSAAEHYLNGDVAKASRHYSKFERKINEEFEEFLDKDFIEEAVIHRLHHISSTKQGGSIVFKNGAASKVEYPQAAHIMKLHSKLNPENKAKIEKLLDSPEGLTRVADFASEHLK